MILPGHLAAGYITTTALLAIVDPTLLPYQKDALLIFGTIAGDFPDLDIAYHMWKYKTISPNNLSLHRGYITHAPIIWMVLGLTVYFLSAGPWAQMAGLMIWLGPWSHFLGDSIEDGVMWLWPFSKKQFALQKHVEAPRIEGNFWQRLAKTYPRRPTFYVETILVVIAIVLFFR